MVQMVVLICWILFATSSSEELENHNDNKNHSSFGKSLVVVERCKIGIAFVEPQSALVFKGGPGVLCLSQLVR
jgi:hypothetical protein